MTENKQSVETVRHKLQLDESLEQHKRGWIIQKIGWGILYSALILALAGVFGSGPLSYKTLIKNGNSVKYERFLRYESEAEMTFNIQNAKDSITLEIPQQYMQYIDLHSITPLPHSNRTVNDVTTYYFHALRTANIHCHLMAKRTGSITAIIKVNETPFTISHQIYP
ncbi:hypothetical protein FAM09_02945 [Niastella caeni]|uniref:Uncharacterized protein n=1 Tax=Niastella caeni TaxID=2569763 RepID=A0A4S8HZH2_9BACT|nr:hypothetical protein [Niastella caeni]THU41090.1 hypothetical protein FAM09_02945 [Niastella caeni]